MASLQIDPIFVDPIFLQTRQPQESAKSVDSGVSADSVDSGVSAERVDSGVSAGAESAESVDSGWSEGAESADGVEAARGADACVEFDDVEKRAQRATRRLQD